MMKKTIPVLILLAFLLVTACKGPIEYITRSGYPNEKNFPFTLKYSDEKEKNKIALIIPPPYMDLHWSENSLAKLLRKEGYTIIITDNGQTNSDISQQEWIAGIYTSYYEMIEASIIPAKPDHFIMIGFEDGAYLLPMLARSMKPDLYFAVNAGPYNPFYEIQSTLKDTLGYKDLYLNLRVLDKEELRMRINKVIDGPGEQVALGNYRNKYWQTFSKVQVMDELLREPRPGPGYYIFSEDHPLLNDTDRLIISQLLPLDGESAVKVIPGKGNFTKEEELENVTGVVNEYINSLR